MFEVIEQLNTYLRGWVGYFRVQAFRYLFRDLDGWIRSRLRSTQLKKWKKPRKFQRVMIKAGFALEEAHQGTSYKPPVKRKTLRVWTHGIFGP